MAAAVSALITPTNAIAPWALEAAIANAVSTSRWHLFIAIYLERDNSGRYLIS